MHAQSKGVLATIVTATFLFACAPAISAAASGNRFEIGQKDFLLNGEKFVIRCGEIHLARIPQEYWRHRLQMCKAMGLNTVSAYLFWNFHEWRQGRYNWEGDRNAAEFCRIAQEEGLWVLLRPGPYSCAEWEMGGLPWWLLKNEGVKLRTRDPFFIEHAQKWLREVGRELAPLQITKGGPILMVQVENEYGYFGEDAEYMGLLRQALIDGGFEVPLFACNPTSMLQKAYRSDLYLVANFGSNPKEGFDNLRKVQPNAPLMCGEFYPAWFDVWGSAHRLGSAETLVRDIEIMLDMGGSFSMYMSHGGTSFGNWAGADQPFKPDTSSYDYDAPVSEAGWVTPKFKTVRASMQKYLLPGETLPEPPAQNSVIAIDAIEFTERAPVFGHTIKPIESEQPQTYEKLDFAHGAGIYETTVPAGPAATLAFKEVRDFGWVYLDGEKIDVTDRRSRKYDLMLPARQKPAQLQVLVYTMGRVNFGQAMHDRKGIHGPVTLSIFGSEPVTLTCWKFYGIPLDGTMPEGFAFTKVTSVEQGPAFWRGTFTLTKTGDTFLDMRTWGKGMVWVNGRSLGRYWNIGPTQTMYVPAPWLKQGTNEVIVLDVLGPEKAQAAGLDQPILGQLRPELDFARAPKKGKLTLQGIKPLLSGQFAQGSAPQEIRFEQPVKARQFCIETLNAHDGKEFAAIGEIDLFNAQGESISHADWTIAYVSSEERVAESALADYAIDGQNANFWHSEWGSAKPNHPHYLVIDLGKEETLTGFRYVPRQGDDKVAGRIKDYRIYAGDRLAAP
ncbi:MAG: beta-galactosidase [Planctomycetaceae bacterium]|nr:beta-galactosidase [Planctomycetaceae bacterium]